MLWWDPSRLLAHLHHVSFIVLFISVLFVYERQRKFEEDGLVDNKLGHSRMRPSEGEMEGRV